MKVTTKGQVTIPARIREYLDISAHSDVDFRISGNNVILFKHKLKSDTPSPFANMRGILKGARTTQQWMQETRGA